ncbi:MAG TPA: hypothetical protein VHC20_07050 [Candidatus Paceibacterota bacterium]|nr:hypothetical protein [Candidatus Paceibacterota bacterium]
MRSYSYILAALCLPASAVAHAQANISSIINRHTAVLIKNRNASVVVRNSFGFAAGG